FQLEPALLARFALFGDARGLMRGGLETRVTTPTAPALRHDEAISRLDQIAKQRASIRIAHQRPGRHFNHQIVGAGTGLVVRPTTSAILCFEVCLVLEVRQRREFGICHQHHIAAVPAIPTSKPAARHKFFTVKVDEAIAAIPTYHVDLYFVNHGYNPATLQVRPRDTMQSCAARLLENRWAQSPTPDALSRWIHASYYAHTNAADSSAR